MHNFLKLRHWELFLMLVLFGRMVSISMWSNRHPSETDRRNPWPCSVAALLPVVYVLLYLSLIIPQPGGADA